MQISEAMYASLRNFFRRRVPHEYDDLTHETLVRLLQQGDASAEQSLQAYAFGIAKHVLSSHLTRGARTRLAGDDPETVPDSSSDCEDSQVSVSVARAVAELPAQSRDAFMLHYVEDFSSSEVAARFGVPHGTAKSLIRSARLSLQRSLQGTAMACQDSSRQLTHQ